MSQEDNDADVIFLDTEDNGDQLLVEWMAEALWISIKDHGQEAAWVMSEFDMDRLCAAWMEYRK